MHHCHSKELRFASSPPRTPLVEMPVREHIYPQMLRSTSRADKQLAMSLLVSERQVEEGEGDVDSKVLRDATVEAESEG